MIVNTSSIDFLREKLSWTSPERDRFLYYLPELLVNPRNSQLYTPSLTRFVSYLSSGVCIEQFQSAIEILNQVVSEDGSRLLPPGPNMFYNNKYFQWKELGEHTDAIGVITHIVNKCVFLRSLEDIR